MKFFYLAWPQGARAQSRIEDILEIEDMELALTAGELAFDEVQLEGSFLALSRLQSLHLLEVLR